MKKIVLIITLVAAVALNVKAGDYDYLTVQKADGTEQSFTSLGLKITFSGSNMLVTQDGTTTTFALADLNKMFFSAESTGIEELEADALTQKATAVYDLQGRKVADNIQLSTLSSHLPKGIYIVGGRKIAVK